MLEQATLMTDDLVLTARHFGAIGAIGELEAAARDSQSSADPVIRRGIVDPGCAGRGEWPRG